MLGLARADRAALGLLLLIWEPLLILSIVSSAGPATRTYRVKE